MCNRRRLRQWAVLILCSQAHAQSFALDDASIVPVTEQKNVPGTREEARDPFADQEEMKLDTQEQNRAMSPEDLQDPFASGSSQLTRQVHNSRLALLPLNFLYQGSYIPNVISAQGSDTTVHNLMLDGTLRWAIDNSAMLKSRVLAERDVQKAGAKVSKSGKILGLEYFYEQRFFDQSQMLTIGRRFLGWSSGFQWRPADLIQNGFTTKQIEIQTPNQYLGIDQISYEINHSNFNIDAVLSNRDYGFYDGVQAALKMGFSGSSGVSLLYSRNGGYSNKYGLILDRALPWSSTLALEAVRIDTDKNLMYDPKHFGRTLESLTGTTSFEEVYVSLKKFIDDKRRVDLEFYYNGSGFKDASSKAVKSLSEAQSVNAVQAQVDTAIFAQQYIGRYYVYMAYSGYFVGWKLRWMPSLLMNSGDHSYIGSTSIAREFRDNSNLTLVLSSYHGAVGTEFGSISRGIGISVSYSVVIF